MNFNPRTREGCDCVNRTDALRIIAYFNPRTREGCDLIKFSDYFHNIIDFNPRTREGCDLPCSSTFVKHLFISIHAPVKGATYRIYVTTVSENISIHAPVKGATHPIALCWQM